MVILVLLAIPLLASAVTALIRDTAPMEAVHVATAGATLAAALWLAAEVLSGGTVSCWNGFLYADSLSALVALLTAFVYCAAAPYAVGYFRRDRENKALDPPAARLRRYYVLTPLFGFSMLLVAVSNNLGVMWVAIEGTTLASIFLVSFYRRKTSLEAAWKYAILGGVGLSMALFGTLLVYYASFQVLGGENLHALNWSELASSAAHFDHTVMRLAFILVLLGYGTKAGLAPMHTWKPDAYSEAPVPVAALMATAVLNCALYGLARVYVLTARCLGPEFVSQLLILFGLLSVGIAVPFILVQRSYRRLLAYSSIDHGGIMVLGLGFGGLLGPLGMLLHMTFHSVTKPLLFFCAGNAQQHTGNDALKKGPGGLLGALPVSAPLFLLATLAVTGTPPFSMFQSEFTILRAGFAGPHKAAAAFLVACVVAIFCGFFYHVSNLVLGPRGGRQEAGAEGRSDPQSPLPCPAEGFGWTTWPLLSLGALIVALGFWLPAPIYALVDGAARILAVRP